MPGIKTDEGREIREAILEFMVGFKRERGFYPTQREIEDALELSRGSTLWHLNSLVSQGYLSYQRGSFARTMKISRRSRELLE